jgi:hypothetical protein
MCRNISDETGITIDGQIVGSTDKATKQLLAISNRLAREIADAFSWPSLQKQHSITLVDGQSTYEMPADLNWAYHETFWNRDEQWPLYGPYSPQERQFLLSGIISRYPYQRYTIRGATDQVFEIDPEPTSTDDGSIIVFEYQSLRPITPRRWVTGQQVTIGDYTEYNGNYYQATTSGTTDSTAPVHTTGVVTDGGVNWEHYAGAYATFRADTDCPVVNPKVFEQGVLERFSERHGVVVTPMYVKQIQRQMEKALPGKKIDVLGRSRARYPNLPGGDWAV